jgi:hypothetical protein
MEATLRFFPVAGCDQYHTNHFFRNDRVDLGWQPEPVACGSLSYYGERPFWRIENWNP